MDVRIIANLQPCCEASRPPAHRQSLPQVRLRVTGSTKVTGQFKHGPKSLQVFPHGLQVPTFRHKPSNTAVENDSSTAYDNQELWPPRFSLSY